METEKDCKYIPFGSDPELDKKYLKAWNKISFLKKHNNYGLDKYYDHVMRQVYGVIFPDIPTYDFVFFIEQGCGIDEIIDITLQFYNHGWHDSDYNEIMLALVKYGRRDSKKIATDSSSVIREEVAKNKKNLTDKQQQLLKQLKSPNKQKKRGFLDRLRGCIKENYKILTNSKNKKGEEK